jgi:receptor-binding and translocation channel-forming TcA subunit of Tc toxin
VQNFGASLLSALEKKDTEELTQLRAVHEQELLKAVRKVKEDSRTEATHSKSGLEQGKKLATQRKTYYTNLLTQAADPELSISKNEQDSLDKQEDAKENESKASKREQGASGINAAPFIGFTFNPFEIKIPFNPLGESPVRSQMAPVTLSYSTANVASALLASANKFRRDSSFKHIESNRAATRGGHEKRKQEWQHQKELAVQEEVQFDKQILAADLRIQLTEKDLAAHDKQIDQSEEVHEFYKDKFTNLGLYTYLATLLSRLYREAYNLAHDMAMKAQRAYQFETDDQTFFIANENWEADKAGFLAGERLMLQLQRMEKAYLDQNRREYEITLPCSLAQINPRALIDLRETGRCDFSVPEVWFDLYYPGQYKRRMKSAHLTVPCVTGPYGNVSAKLTLTGSRIRPEAELNSELIGIPHQRNTSVAASTANNDSGVFELNFRDERYVPFEGAGAVGDWSLELPSVFRPFDYDTISDVILHISYTARTTGVSGRKSRAI